ncbi:MAG: hypothetical protein Q8O89_03850 [Nanoarchaeota archaeon]|nr:hypothetical protein [Nanoarchaeota archaeon]
MVDKCKDHNKDAVTRCVWCNKALCSICEGLRDGKKVYCGNCSKKLSEHISEKNLRRAEAESNMEMTHFKRK